MMLAVDNRLPQPPNLSWNAMPAPFGEQIALTDATKTYAWIGYIADAEAPLPVLKAGGSVVAGQQPAFWSHLADQA